MEASSRLPKRKEKSDSLFPGGMGTGRDGGAEERNEDGGEPGGGEEEEDEEEGEPSPE